MRKQIIILATAIIAGIATCGFAEHGMWLPAIGCIGWNVFLLIVNTTRKKPRAATRSKEDIVPMKPLYTYDTTLQHWTQDMKERWRA